MSVATSTSTHELNVPATTTVETPVTSTVSTTVAATTQPAFAAVTSAPAATVVTSQPPTIEQLQQALAQSAQSQTVAPVYSQNQLTRRLTSTGVDDPTTPVYVGAGDQAALMASCVLSLVVSLLLASLLSVHLPNAFQNISSIEENYDNMPNPFDYGSDQRARVKNLSQIFGQFGYDWFFPLDPWHPLSDGISFPRPSEEMLHPKDLNLHLEDIWRLRYAIQKQETELDPIPQSSTAGIFDPISRWLNGAF